MPSAPAVSRFLREGLDLWAEPSRLGDLGQLGREAAADLARFLLLQPDPDTALRGELGVAKCAAWSRDIPLQEITIIRRSVGEPSTTYCSRSSLAPCAATSRVAVNRWIVLASASPSPSAFGGRAKRVN